jgi:hypothetical protein
MCEKNVAPRVALFTPFTLVIRTRTQGVRRVNGLTIIRIGAALASNPDARGVATLMSNKLIRQVRQHAQGCGARRLTLSFQQIRSKKKK